MLFIILCYSERQGGINLIQYKSVHVETLEVLLKTILCDYGVREVGADKRALHDALLKDGWDDQY